MSTSAAQSNPESVGSGRPSYHIAPPRGWINDPCAPGYDSTTGLYHLFYQWNPHSHAWNNISWGHATSRDLVHWEHTRNEPVFVPDQPYDKCGIFTGCFYGAGPSGEEDQLSIFYSSVNYLPITWSQPYTRGCESLSLATSMDGGKTWTKHPGNPILSEEPADMHVTGFRDPYIAPWPAMDKLRQSPPTLYGLISGGIHDLGPRTFLYAIDPKDLTQWKYLHPLTPDLAVNHSLSTKWAGDFGANWECTNFVTLKNGDISRDFVISGAEGGKERTWVTDYHEANPKAARRVPRYPNWFGGKLAKDNEEVSLSVDSAGLVDWGIYYAASTFIAPDGRTIMWGWIIEEDVADDLLAVKTWTGCMGIPREIFLQKLEGVQGALTSSLESISSLEVVKQTSQGASIYTLGIRPVKETQSLRDKLIYSQTPGPLIPARQFLDNASLNCEVKAVFNVSENTEFVSLIVRHNADMSIRTSIVYRPKEETLTVEREHSSGGETINRSPEIGSHTLFRLPGGNIEPLALTVYLDHDIIEVFANERFALATRVYTEPEHTGVSISCEGAGSVKDLRIWSMRSIDAQAAQAV